MLQITQYTSLLFLFKHPIMSQKDLISKKKSYIFIHVVNICIHVLFPWVAPYFHLVLLSFCLKEIRYYIVLQICLKKILPTFF